MHRKKLLLILVFVLLVFVSLPLFAGMYDVDIIDTPKAYTGYRGDLHFNFTVYDNGGILTNGILSITDWAFLGIYFDIGNFIGAGAMTFNQPGVLARFLLSDGAGALPAIAIGWSYFIKGEAGKVDDTIVNGPYLVVSHYYFLFRTEQNLSWGLRYPVVPLDYSKPENLTFFIGTDVELSPAFSIKAEIENLHFVQGRWQENYYNLAFDFNIIDLLSIMVELKYSPSVNVLERILTIGYYTQF
ncbi:MAG: hypothetical protein AMS17_13355 [Spirochaetes bacterium DG_61]|nr:MAG: hypothetical protein AMS17_13355 [Spirochaetes bacterium DG_61]